MAESRAAFQATAAILEALRLEVQANTMLIQSLQDTTKRLEQLLARHHEALYEGNGKPGFHAQMLFLQREVEELGHWRKAVDLYRENVRAMHVNFHHEIDMPKLEQLKGKNALKTALVSAGGTVLVLLLTAILGWLKILPMPGK